MRKEVRKKLEEGAAISREDGVTEKKYVIAFLAVHAQVSLMAAEDYYNNNIGGSDAEV